MARGKGLGKECRMQGGKAGKAGNGEAKEAGKDDIDGKGSK